jgi:mono/diheme cytochrome c family protein
MKPFPLMIVTVLGIPVVLEGCSSSTASPDHPPAASAATAPFDTTIQNNVQAMFEEGRRIFRYDTFGDEAFWSETLGLHRAIAGENLGGVGVGVSPTAALGLGLKVDMDALPAELVTQIQAGQVDMDDPATTLALIKLNAVLGVVGTFDEGGQLQAVGLTCAVCHSDVDDAFAPGIGHRLDGFGNRDLNVGAIIASAPNLEPIATLLATDVATVKQVLGSWGPGKFDAELDKDGRAFRPDGKPAATIIPNAFGMAGVNLHTWTGAWGTVTYWNAYVANTELKGQGTFFDPRLNDAAKYPVSTRSGAWNMRSEEDLITSKLGALHFYQLAIPAPVPPAGSFDQAAAERGEALFSSKARCATCHVPPLFTEPGWNLHTADEIGIDDFQASRSPDNRYRTAPLRGLWTRMDGPGFYHDGRFPDLGSVIDHYDDHLELNLSESERNDLVEYLKSL